MIRTEPVKNRLFPLLVLLTLLISCSHKYNSDVLDLSFYQWNQWPDTEAVSHDLPPNPPTCGWEVLHRGNGKLVRIPTMMENYSGVSWYHCRFTLPDIWEQRKIVLSFEGAGPEVEVYLNKVLVSHQSGNNAAFQLDLTDQIYYTLDNHMAIRITDPEGGGGISGNIIVISSVKSDPSPLTVLRLRLRSCGSSTIHHSPSTIHHPPLTLHPSPLTNHQSPFTPHHLQSVNLLVDQPH